MPMGGDFLTKVPRWIAEQLELPDPASYTSNSLRRSLAANAAENSSAAQLKVTTIFIQIEAVLLLI